MFKLQKIKHTKDKILKYKRKNIQKIKFTKDKFFSYKE